jgi:hypothetical protein
MPPLVPSLKGSTTSTCFKHNNQNFKDNPSFVKDDNYFVVDEPKHSKVYNF